jgi:hypothetical protein
MGVPVDTVQLKALIQVQASHRRLRQLNAPPDLLAQAIMEVAQEVTAGEDPSYVYQQLTDEITQFVQFNNFTELLQSIAQTLGAEATAQVQVNSVVNSDPRIFIPPASPTKSPIGSSSGSDEGLSIGEIVGIVIAGTNGFVLTVLFLIWLRSRGKATEDVLSPNVGHDIDVIVPRIVNL